MLPRSELQNYLSQPKKTNNITSFLTNKDKPQTAVQSHNDLNNLLQCWLHALLCYKQVYPQTLFQTKTVYGILLPIALPGPLKDYLDKFIIKIKQFWQHLSWVEVRLHHNNQQIECWRLNFLIQEEGQTGFWQSGINLRNQHNVNVIQKELEYKMFLNGFKETMSRSKDNQLAQNQVVNWTVNIGYRMQDNLNLRKEKRELLDNLVQVEPNSDHMTVLASLKAPHLNLIYECSTLINNN